MKLRETRSESRARISPLNNLAVFTSDLVASEWHQLDEAQKLLKARQYLDVLQNTAIKSQIEVRTLLRQTELRQSYAFDIPYDLARMFAVEAQLKNYIENLERKQSLDDSVKYLKEALATATAAQRNAIRQDFVSDPSFAGLPDEDKAMLQQAVAG